MVAVTDERAYAGLVQPFQAIDELELRAEAPIGRVVDIARDEQRVHPLVDAQLDDVLVGGKRRVVQRPSNIVGSDGPYADERAVEVQIGGMYETDTGHVPLSAVVWWMGKYSQPHRVSLTRRTVRRTRVIIGQDRPQTRREPRPRRPSSPRTGLQRSPRDSVPGRGTIPP